MHVGPNRLWSGAKLQVSLGSVVVTSAGGLVNVLVRLRLQIISCARADPGGRIRFWRGDRLETLTCAPDTVCPIVKAESTIVSFLALPAAE